MQQKGILGSLLLVLTLGMLLILTLVLLYGSPAVQTKPIQTTTQNTVPLQPPGGSLTATLTSSNPLIDLGNVVETLTANISGGTIPYTVNFFNVTGNRLLLSEISYQWTATSPYPENVEAQNCVVSSYNYIYCIGGQSNYGDGTAYYAVYYAPILASNALGSWTSTNSYPTPVAGKSCIASYSNIYCIGGEGGAGDVYYAPILPSNALGPWTITTSYPTTIEDQSCITSSNNIYCIGGYGPGGLDSQIYYAPILGSGALGQWTITNPYPVSELDQSCITSSNNIYCIGGYTSLFTGQGTNYNAVYYAPILPSNALGSWTSTSHYPTNNIPICVTSLNKIYCIGGNTQNAVYYAPILPSNALGSWTSTSSFPENDTGQSCITSSNNVYCIGGESQNNENNNLTYYAPILSSGALATASPITYTFTTNSLTQGNFLQYNVIVTDSSQTTVSATNSIKVTVPTITLVPSVVDVNNGQAETLTANIVGGIPGYVINLFNVTGDKNAKIFGYEQWLNTSSYPTPIAYQSCTAYANNIYCLGGYNNLFNNYYNPQNVSYQAQVLSSGELGPWSSANSYPTPDLYQSCVASSGNIYCIGGFNYDNGTDNLTYYAPISNSGVLGQWSSANSYPANVEDQSCITSSNNIYCIGGDSYNYGGVSYNSVYYAPILGSGALGSWSSANSYPENDTDPSCAVSSNNIYCMGGDIGLSDGLPQNVVYYAPIFNSGVLGAWTNANSYPVNVELQSCAGLPGYIYCIGGQNVGHENYSNSSYYAPVFNSGGIGAWIATETYPLRTSGSSCVVVSNSIYCLGGEWSSSTYNNVYYAPVSNLGIANSLTYTFTPNSAAVNYALQFNALVTDSGIPSQLSANSITNTIIINPFVPPTTTIGGGGGGGNGGGSSTAGGTGGGGGSPSKPVITITNSNYNVSNIAQLNSFNISPSGTAFKVTDNYITPNSTGVTINGIQYILVLNKSVLIKNTQTTNYYARLVAISYVPILQTVNIYFYSNSTGIPAPIINGAYNLTGEKATIINVPDTGTAVILTSPSNTTARLIVTDLTGKTSSPKNYEPLTVLNVSTSGTNITTYLLVKYSCSIPAGAIAPYKLLSNGTWTQINNFLVNSSSCNAGFMIPPDPVVGLFESLITTTTTVLPTTSSTSRVTSSSTVPATTIQSSNKSEDSAIAAVIIVILILLIIAYLSTRKHKGKAKQKDRKKKRKGKEQKKKQEIVSV